MRAAFIVSSIVIGGFVAIRMAVPPYVTTTINDFMLPGSQPDPNHDLIEPSDCQGCHGDYDSSVEPSFNWRGTMMAQAGRDPLFLAAMTIANQDAPESGDLCIRCHMPKGWLEERSTPTDGSALIDKDRESVLCHFCHKLVKPSPVGVNPYPGDPDYTSDTFSIDTTVLAGLADIPSESAHGQYVVDIQDRRRGPYASTAAPHDFYPSPFHREAALCGTCHDVSNPVFSLSAGGRYVANAMDTPPPSASPDSLFPIERTYSEWLASDYNSPSGVYAPQFGGNKDTVATCQDCHMRDVTGKGCNEGGAPTRTDLGLHDLTGGNTFIPKLIDLAYPGEADQAALNAGILRARYMLQEAASMEIEVVPQADSFQAHITVTNETGHKLPSGYPEGRRIWINLRAFDESDVLIYESGAYDTTTAVLTKDPDAKVYEIKPGLSPDLAFALGLTAGPSFHFVLNDTIYFDNRIPPRGFTNAAFEAIQSPPVGYAYPDGQYWDDTYYGLPAETRKVVAKLYYQTTSKEFIEFLQSENETNHWGDSLYSWWFANGKSRPELMETDSVEVESVGLTLDLKVHLEGAYAGGDSMKVTPTYLAAVPTAHPFSDALFNGTPLEYDAASSVSAWNPDDIDWVLVSLRTDTSAGSEVFSIPAVLRKDGSVVDTAGSVPTTTAAVPGSYYVVVRQRNHLPVMSPAAVDCSGATCSWDFTTGIGQAFSGDRDPMKVATDGKTVMIAGDLSLDGQITVVDFAIWLVDTKAGATGYQQSDISFDANATVSDFSFWLVNTKAGYANQVP